MISKFVSPISSVAMNRGHQLREILDIPKGSAVLSRAARDNVEHFDERIDNMVRDDSDGILECVLQNRSVLDFGTLRNLRVKRVHLLEEMIFISEGRDGSRFEVELQSLKDEVDQITQRSDEWIENHSPYEYIFPQQI